MTKSRNLASAFSRGAALALPDRTNLAQEKGPCEFSLGEVTKQVGICTFFGVLDDDRRSAQPSGCYDTFGWLDFPTGVVIKNQTFALVLLVTQPMFLTNSLIERHASGGRDAFGYLRLNHYCLSRRYQHARRVPTSGSGGTVMLFRQLGSGRVFALSLVLVNQNSIEPMSLTFGHSLVRKRRSITLTSHPAGRRMSAFFREPSHPMLGRS